eukprot:gene10516-12443_t
MSCVEELFQAERKDLYQHLAYSPGAWTHDSWVGNYKTSANTGKSCKAPSMPAKAQGRQDLFDTLHHTTHYGGKVPGDTMEDAWHGHYKIDPTKGRICPIPPFMSSGRMDLYDTIQQSGKPRKGDPGADSWQGNVLSDPLKGRGNVNGYKKTKDYMNNFADIVRHEDPTAKGETLPGRHHKYPVGGGMLHGTQGGIGKKTCGEHFTQEVRDKNGFKNTIEFVPVPDGVTLYESQYALTTQSSRGVEYYIKNLMLLCKNVCHNLEVFQQ